jgi:hypothetical protein
MAELPESTFTKEDHRKIELAMVMHDEMKNMLFRLHAQYFRGRRIEPSHKKMVNDLESLVEKLKRY